MKLLTPLLFVCLLGCQSGPSEEKTATDHNTHTYQPEDGTLVITAADVNSEVTQVKLLNDKKEDSLAAVVPQDGKFTLTASQLPLREVYFLEISGRSQRTGTSGLECTEHVPVYFETHEAPLALTHRTFNHPGSISGTLFSIQGGSSEQALLNRWQTALTQQQAEAEGKVVGATLGQSGFSGEGGGTATAADQRRLTQQFIQPDTPSVAAMFLAYTGNAHRKQVDTYRKLYEGAPASMQQTKYGVDLADRLDRISHPVEALDLEQQVAIVDPTLKRPTWSDFATYDRLLLCFWDSGNPAIYPDIQAINDQADSLQNQGTLLVHVAMDQRLSQWKEATQPLNLVHNYKLRNGSRQSLIDALYLTDLPRYVLTRPDGQVIDADVSPASVQELLTP